MLYPFVEDKGPNFSLAANELAAKLKNLAPFMLDLNEVK